MAVPPYSTGDKRSFAYVTACKRWPVILTSAIDSLHRASLFAEPAEKQKEGKEIIEGLAKLKHEIQHDRPLLPIPDDGQHDITRYNTELEQLGTPNWFSVPWLYAECYLYRRLSSLFTLSTHWKTYDVFETQKTSSFRSSRAAVLELAARYRAIIDELQGRQSAGTSSTPAASEERLRAEELRFAEMCDVCLWGNATDLSLLTNLSHADISALQGAAARKAAEKNVLVNDLSAAFAVLHAAQKSGKLDRRVDIVLDNAGFELFVDLVLAGYLLATGLATTVVLHPKSIPWFVSDVTPPDFSMLLNALAAPESFFNPATEVREGGQQPLHDEEIKNLHFLITHWSSLHAEGQLVLRPNRFWTDGGAYSRMPSDAPRLYEDLQTSELVIFKGDLNYRKLTGDLMWPPTTAFVDAIGGLGPRSNLRILALRTCKADVVVGLPEGLDERLRQSDGGGANGGDGDARRWACTGKWAVIQFSDGKLQR